MSNDHLTIVSDSTDINTDGNADPVTVLDAPAGAEQVDTVEPAEVEVDENLEISDEADVAAVAAEAVAAMRALKSLKGVVFEVDTDKAYSGAPLEVGDWILVDNANILLMAPFLAVDAGRDGWYQEWLLNRIYGVRFTPGRPVIFNGTSGDRGHGTTYDPFYVAQPDGKNRHLKPEVRFRRRSDNKFIVNEAETIALEERRQTYVKLLQGVQGQRLDIAEGPKFKAKCLKTELLKLKFNVEEVMSFGYRNAQWINAERAKRQAILNNVDDDGNRLDDLSEVELNVIEAEHNDFIPLLLPADEGWNETLNTATPRGWEEFWKRRCKDVANMDESELEYAEALLPSSSMPNIDLRYADVANVAASIVSQLVTVTGDGMAWVPLELLASTEGVIDVYVQKTGPVACRLDHPDLETMNRIAREPNLEEMVRRINTQWDAAVAKLEAAGMDHDEAEEAHAASTGRTLEERHEAARRARRHASVFIQETSVLDLQLWFTRGRNAMITGIKAALGRKGLATKFQAPTAPQGIKLMPDRTVGAVPRRGGL